MNTPTRGGREDQNIKGPTGLTRCNWIRLNLEHSKKKKKREKHSYPCGTPLLPVTPSFIHLSYNLSASDTCALYWVLLICRLAEGPVDEHDNQSGTGLGTRAVVGLPANARLIKTGMALLKKCQAGVATVKKESPCESENDLDSREAKGCQPTAH